MLRKSVVAVLISLSGSIALAQTKDVLIIQSGSGPSGGPVSVPVSIADLAGTSLGSDKSVGNRIQGFAFKITFPAEIVASVSFARAGLTASLTPMFETQFQGTGFASAIVSFEESSDPIPFVSNAPFPGNQIGTLTVLLQPSLAVGTTAQLTIDAPSAILSNQAGTVSETVANDGLSLQNGSVSVSASAPLGTPAALVASALSATQVNLNWQTVANADHYDVFRSANGGAFHVAGTPAGAAFSDANVVAHDTLVYRVRAVSSEGGASAMSNFDPATTSFTNEPLAVGATLVGAIHLTEVRNAVNSLRMTAGLPAVSAATLVAGSMIRAQHITDFRTALNEARTTLGIGTVTFAEPLTAGTTTIKASHVEELRGGVK